MRSPQGGATWHVAERQRLVAGASAAIAPERQAAGEPIAATGDD